MRIHSLSFIFTYVIFFAACTNQPAIEVDTVKIEHSLKPAAIFTEQKTEYALVDRMQRYGVSALSLAIVDDGKLVLSKAYGSLSETDDTPISTNTVFQASSLSKAITALGVLSLVDDGVFDLDTPANEVLTSWRIPTSVNTKDDPISIAELLSHSGGINVQSYGGYIDGEPLPTLDDILNGAEPAKSEAVRATLSQGQYIYSGGGYSILEKVVEDQTGMPFNEFMVQVIFDPIKAVNTNFVETPPHLSSESIAVGHNYSGQKHGGGWLVYPQSSAAGLWTTPSDLANILIEYMQAYSGAKNKLLSPATARKVPLAVNETMGLGFGTHGDGIALHIDHAGWNRGYRAYMVAFPERQDAVVVMVNGDGGNRLIDEVVRAVDTELGWGIFKATQYDYIEWGQDQRKRLAGHYRMSPANFRIKIEETGEHLLMSTPRGSTHQLRPISNQELVMIEDGSRITLNKEDGSLKLWGMTALRDD